MPNWLSLAIKGFDSLVSSFQEHLPEVKYPTGMWQFSHYQNEQIDLWSSDM